MPCFVASCVLALLAHPAAAGWRSSLYPENWTPPGSERSFGTDKILQDFSYAGYKRGEQPIPRITGPVFNVLNYGADARGGRDSTGAIQSAINAAAAAGGGVVFLPQGTYRVQPQGNQNHALRISNSGIVLRGAGAEKTFIVNASHEMRNKHVILVQPTSASTGSRVALKADLERPTRRIPVANARAFSVGDIVYMEWDFTPAWINEHNQAAWWNDANGRPESARYLREVVAVNTLDGTIEVDIPTRYTMKVRDNARVARLTGMLSDVGLEHFSIGNVQHPGRDFGENNYRTPDTAAYDAHGSFLIRVSGSYDSWVSHVHSFQPVGNTTTCHMLSNGIGLSRCFRVTIRNTSMRRSQFGGGGGNGYMFRVQNSNENLLVECVADFSRHGFVLSHAGSSGNVFLRCEDRHTARSTGSSGSYNTSGSGSDHHMHFSHSNLFDSCLAHDSFFTASHRGRSGGTPHGLSSAHGVYWNMRGSGSRYSTIVRSEQARYGYVIGTSGPQSRVSTPTGGNTAPEDHSEGVGRGETLEPQSLYEDQFARRTGGASRQTSAEWGQPALLLEEQEWTNAEGRTIRAAVERYDGETVRFVMPDGSGVDYPAANLSEESRERLARANDE